MFYLVSINESFGKLLGHPIKAGDFMKTYWFYDQLSLEDKRIPKHKGVYLMIPESKKTFKIGRTFDFQRRYSNAKKSELIKYVPVKNDTYVEKLLLDEFKKTCSLISGSKEEFEMTLSESTINRKFNEIISPYKDEFDSDDSEFIAHIRYTNTYQGYWVSKEVVRILINHFIEDSKDKQDCLTLLEDASIDMGDVIFPFHERDEKEKVNYTYWKFHRYTIVQRDDNLYVNGSRLWNSIKRVEGSSKTTTFSTFLKSKAIQNLAPQFQELFGSDVPMYTNTVTNKQYPHFSGIYVHFLLVHFIVEHLSAKYALLVSLLMYKRFNGKIPKSISPSVMSGGYISENFDEDSEETVLQLSELRKVKKYKDQLTALYEVYLNNKA